MFRFAAIREHVRDWRERWRESAECFITGVAACIVLGVLEELAAQAQRDIALWPPAGPLDRS